MKRNFTKLGRDPAETAVRQWKSAAFQKSKLLLSFQFGQHGGSLGISNLLPFFIAFLAHGKSPVVDQPAASQRLVDEVFLFSVRVDPEFDPFLH